MVRPYWPAPGRTQAPRSRSRRVSGRSRLPARGSNAPAQSRKAVPASMVYGNTNSLRSRRARLGREALPPTGHTHARRRGGGSPRQARQSPGGLLPRCPRGTSAPRASFRGRAARPRPPWQVGGGTTSPSRSREASRLIPSKAHGRPPRVYQLNRPPTTRWWIPTTVLSKQHDRPADGWRRASGCPTCKRSTYVLQIR